MAGNIKIINVQGVDYDVRSDLDEAISNLESTKASKDVATVSEDGLMSSEDKQNLDSIFKGGNLQLPTPVITGTWSFFNNTGSPATITPTPSLKNPKIEKGYKAQFTGTYKWVHEEGKKDPTKVQSGSSWSDLPLSNVNSNTFTSEMFTSDSTVKIGIQAPKTGLMVSGDSVIPATGDDTSTATESVSFLDREYHGYLIKNTGITEGDIKGLEETELISSKSKNITVNAGDNQYFVYAYSKSLGKLSVISVGANDFTTAFKEPVEVTITNEAGASIAFYVYVTNQPGAFKNKTVSFK